MLPEYAVDIVFAWQAAADPVHYGPLALANTTGANRLREAGLVFTLFIAQFILGGFAPIVEETHVVFTVLYAGLTVVYLVRDPRSVTRLLRGVRGLVASKP